MFQTCFKEMRHESWSLLTEFRLHSYLVCSAGCYLYGGESIVQPALIPGCLQLTALLTKETYTPLTVANIISSVGNWAISAFALSINIYCIASWMLLISMCMYDNINKNWHCVFLLQQWNKNRFRSGPSPTGSMLSWQRWAMIWILNSLQGLTN